MNISQMKYYSQLLGYSYERLAEVSGIPRESIERIFEGDAKSISYDTLLALEQVLNPEKEDMVAETQAACSFPKRVYTLEDYYALPDERRVELIDGVFYDMAAPATIHQTIVFQMGYQIESYIEKKGGDCVLYISPVDVQLDCDDKTMVQPDVFILCDRSKDIDRCIYGAPDFIAEVLSPATRRKDIGIKTFKYANAGVKEYWIIDAQMRQVMVYQFEQINKEEYTDRINVYGFHDKIPVQLYKGELKIDFDRISQKLGRNF